MRSFAALLALTVSGCLDDDSTLPGLDSGRPTDAAIDAARDATASASQLDAGASCYSPIALPSGRELGVVGCSCVWGTPGYCIDGNSITCGGSRWDIASGGPCDGFPRQMGSCANDVLQGTLLVDAGACPSGFATRPGEPRMRSDDELGTCCYPIRVPRSNCVSAGFRVESATEADASIATQCAQGSLKALIVGERTAALCCD